MDAVINHMAAGSGKGVAGSTYGNRQYPYYSPQDFHHYDNNLYQNCGVNDYTNKYNVQVTIVVAIRCCISLTLQVYIFISQSRIILLQLPQLLLFLQYCDLSGLPDLCTSCSYVQSTVANYINTMSSYGKRT